MTQQPVRPRNVVIVDAENPLEEVRGEFFWREDHDRIVTQERESAYEAGYGEGFAAAARRHQRIVVRYRRRFLPSLIMRFVALLVMVAFAVTLLGGMLEGHPHP